MIKNETLFLNELWKDSLSVYENILKLPFIVELTEGTLSARRFVHYLQQDALYLLDYARALLLIGAKASMRSDIISFIKFAEGALIEEKALHDYYFNEYNIDPNVEKNDACFAYTHYLISIAAVSSLEEAIAAVLPCFWIYRDVGNYIHQNSVGNNPYEKWISNYANEAFSQAVNEALFICERMYRESSIYTQKVMRKAALQSSLLEWRFWDEPYRSVSLR